MLSVLFDPVNAAIAPSNIFMDSFCLCFSSNTLWQLSSISSFLQEWNSRKRRPASSSVSASYWKRSVDLQFKGLWFDSVSSLVGSNLWKRLSGNSIHRNKIILIPCDVTSACPVKQLLCWIVVFHNFGNEIFGIPPISQSIAALNNISLCIVPKCMFLGINTNFRIHVTHYLRPNVVFNMFGFLSVS